MDKTRDHIPFRIHPVVPIASWRAVLVARLDERLVSDLRLIRKTAKGDLDLQLVRARFVQRPHNARVDNASEMEKTSMLMTPSEKSEDSLLGKSREVAVL